MKLSKATLARAVVLVLLPGLIPVSPAAAGPEPKLDVVRVPPVQEVMVGSARDGSPRPPRLVSSPGFRIGRTEVTCGEFAAFLHDTGHPFSSPQFRDEHGRRRPVDADHAVAYVTLADATAYTRWLSEMSREHVRLPTPDEWEIAARGGIPGADFPWGWGSVTGRMASARTQPGPTGQFPPNRFGLHDVAGHLAEWCVIDGVSYTAGGSWAEVSEFRCAVWSIHPTDAAYRDADVGFRILLPNKELEEPEQNAEN